ncbi:hypothetical protein E6O75_ATG05632 [Venturia nashicola]|uniref:DUF7703 domain-containing protein n=1 Tax=Venturia nashicola TaxID=86259 RepID=A0A4Z1NY45_9PEZI|nr:hypothetical protein E6O75_ATG05632 [Venturia nashicola]
MENDDCVKFIPFSHYDWTYARSGWLPWNPTAFALIASFCAIAYWMCLELLVLVYVTFRRHTGVYFYSIIITTLGLILQTTGYILKVFENSCPPVLVTIICKLGWVANVTGFSVVLWSRLHLIVDDPRILRGILIMIITNGIICHTPVVVFEFGLMSKQHSTYYLPMQITERIQQTIFTIQETVLSSLYIYHTFRFLSAGYTTHTRNVITLLLCVQITVVALDAMLTVFDYMDKFTLKCTIHPFVYSIKLKLEFIVLNHLQILVKQGLVTPGLSLTSNIAPSASSIATLPQRPVEKQRPVPVFERDFITETGIGSASTSLTTVDSDSVKERRKDHESIDSNGTLKGEEVDWKHITGNPDNQVIVISPNEEDIERLYLGRWNGRGLS